MWINLEHAYWEGRWYCGLEDGSRAILEEEENDEEDGEDDETNDECRDECRCIIRLLARILVSGRHIRRRARIEGVGAVSGDGGKDCWM